MNASVHIFRKLSLAKVHVQWNSIVTHTCIQELWCSMLLFIECSENAVSDIAAVQSQFQRTQGSKNLLISLHLMFMICHQMAGTTGFVQTRKIKSKIHEKPLLNC